MQKVMLNYTFCDNHKRGVHVRSREKKIFILLIIWRLGLSCYEEERGREKERKKKVVCVSWAINKSLEWNDMA